MGLDAVHGQRATYTSGCRCDDCTVANRKYARVWDVRRRETRVLDTSDRADPGKERARLVRRVVNGARHGTAAGYQYDGCRCWPCTDAASSAQAQRRKRRRTERP